MGAAIAPPHLLLPETGSGGDNVWRSRMLSITRTDNVRPHNWSLCKQFSRKAGRAALELGWFIQRTASTPISNLTKSAIKDVAWYLSEDFVKGAIGNSLDCRTFTLAASDAGLAPPGGSYLEMRELHGTVLTEIANILVSRNVRRPVLEKLQRLCRALDQRSRQIQFTVYHQWR